VHKRTYFTSGFFLSTDGVRVIDCERSLARDDEGLPLASWHHPRIRIKGVVGIPATCPLIQAASPRGHSPDVHDLVVDEGS